MRLNVGWPEVGLNCWSQIRRTNPAGNEYWSSRDFARVLGYTDYRNFEAVSDRASMACFNDGQRMEDHFVEITEMIQTDGSGDSETPQPGFDFLVGHHIVGSEQPLLGKKHNPPLPPCPAFEQIFPQPSNPQPRMLVRISKTIRQCAQRRGNLPALGGAEFGSALPQPRVKVNPHSLPVNGLD